MSFSIQLEAAGRELHIDIRGRLFIVPVDDGVVQRRDVIDVACDARLEMQELGALYRHIEGFGVTLDGPVYTVRV
ncbi:hypothetical protein BJF92_13645 [Rhizobium rhizosphaerae]|uniref:Uncharacterized protein n=1 Tax=Xaviernesmea rhizosphaerae TaxID=1672749 RepID=A0A1Q9AHX1_9HYPH|nr:hypothetical protein [Xaviernesmea rhizosphaerae]OLP54848.1 hypothetical protein BJF92_13645 [Xaviernesmea rhizosphaerae]